MKKYCLSDFCSNDNLFNNSNVTVIKENPPYYSYCDDNLKFIIEIKLELKKDEDTFLILNNNSFSHFSDIEIFHHNNKNFNNIEMNKVNDDIKKLIFSYLPCCKLTGFLSTIGSTSKLHNFIIKNQEKTNKIINKIDYLLKFKLHDLTIEKFKSHFNPKLNINEINSTVNYFNDKIICNKIKYCQYGIFLKSKINETISIKINAFRIHYWLNKIATDVSYISNVKNYMRIIGGFIG